MSELVWEHHPLRGRFVPERWAVATLRDLTDSIQPGFPSGQHNREQKGVPHLRPMNISRTGAIDLSDVKYVEARAGFEVRNGDILFNNTNSPELIGKTAACGLDATLAFSNHMTRVRTNSAADPKFIAYELHWLWMTGYFRHRCINHVNQASISSVPLSETVPVVIPSLAEQRRIVAEIEKQFTRLEAAGAILRRVQQKTGILRREIVKPFRLEANFSQPLPDLPDGWSWRFAKDLCHFITKGTTPAKRDFREREGIPYIKVNNLGFNGELHFDERPTFISREVHETDLARSEVLPGDVLMNIVGPPLGKVSKVPAAYPRWNINQAIARFRPKAEITAEFLAVVLQSTWTLRWLLGMTKATVGQVNLTLEICRNIPIPVPPTTSEQKKIVDQVEALTSELDANKGVLKQVQAHAARLRQSILAKAFSGQLVPQDPNEEPASMLLEEIRAQRETASKQAVRSRRASTRKELTVQL